MDCPVCHIPLIAVERQKVEVDYCIQCKGFWFDISELELLMENLAIPVDFPDFFALPAKKEKTLKRRCPRCPKKMETVVLPLQPPLALERCPALHGLWFDAGELSRAVEGYSKATKGDHPVIHYLGETFYLRR